jgi:hypothetical protein
MIRRGLLSILMLTLGLIPLAWADKPTTPTPMVRPPGADESEKRFRRIYEQDGTFHRLVAATDRLQELIARLQFIQSALLSSDVHEEQFKSLVLRCDDLQPRLDRNESEIAVVLLLLRQARIDAKTDSLTDFEKTAITRHQTRVIEPLKCLFESSDQDKAGYPGSRDGINDLRDALGGNQEMEVKTANARKAAAEAVARLDGLSDRLTQAIDEMRVLGGDKDVDDLIRKLIVIEKEEERQRAILNVLKHWAHPRHPSIFGDP